MRAEHFEISTDFTDTCFNDAKVAQGAVRPEQRTSVSRGQLAEKTSLKLFC